ncbi:MAG: NAD(P)H-dependent oxidoreductase subunit E [Lentimicrobiaceae bacterium]|jgi:NADH:ubiquinone oxidoreductase subunit E|nr:NAD(P)H-dependent oxidoreductase subunit E [Lentimicrobiaceae bacterium]MDD4597456.1 NAD(P)H-dependent oxidoreductase subunit E [Lentimicrobiaceae bacterium]MDY0026027.1 NAD(P)H-dependent oxidoreductase subunit E [Lentimicrobium sp.]HAH59936.1 electron transport complex protein RnfG [Bacteroidales bacterium]
MNQKNQIIICMGSSCFSRGNRVNLELIKAWLSERKIEAEVGFKGQLCTGLCNKGPVLIINEHVYQEVHPANVINILKTAFSGAQV